jgi:20S proteasome subunit alpha 4
MSYDKSLSIFSQGGKLYQVDYAKESVKKGGLSIGVLADKCVILAAERKAVPKLQDARTIKKINRVDNHVFISYAGIIADSRSLIDYVRLESQSYRYALDTTPSLEYLSKQIAFRQQE